MRNCEKREDVFAFNGKAKSHTGHHGAAPDVPTHPVTHPAARKPNRARSAPKRSPCPSPGCRHEPTAPGEPSGGEPGPAPRAGSAGHSTRPGTGLSRRGEGAIHVEEANRAGPRRHGPAGHAGKRDVLAPPAARRLDVAAQPRSGPAEPWRR